MISKKECNGCSCCREICPVGAISMCEDTEGFLYPSVDIQKCTNCGLCKRKCPTKQKSINSVSIKAYAAYSLNNEVRVTSSSGGLFTVFAEYVINKGGVIFGCVLKDHFRSAVHISVNNKNDLIKLRGSKYLQSDINQAYSKAKAFLQNGRMVLFSGTPCQIAGLKVYLKDIEYDNLITIDVICHGVPSPKIWRNYIEYREKQTDSVTRGVFFRNKDSGWKNFSLLFEFMNNTIYKKILSNDLYLKGFIANLYLRPSCYHCPFKNSNYYSDITLADFWGIDNVIPEMNDDKGVSLVITHTTKGENLYHSITDKVKTVEVNFTKALASNPSYFKSVSKNPLREHAMHDFMSMRVDKVIDKYCGKSIISRTRRKIYRYFGGTL